jgi:hypothetical protein
MDSRDMISLLSSSVNQSMWINEKPFIGALGRRRVER